MTDDELGYFTALDGYNVETIWYGRVDDHDPRPVLSLDSLSPDDHDLWPQIVEAICGAPTAAPIGYAVVKERGGSLSVVPDGAVHRGRAGAEAWRDGYRSGRGNYHVVALHPIS